MAETARESPLHAWRAGGTERPSIIGDQVIVAEQPFRALLNIRGDPGSTAFAGAFRECLGLAALPRANHWVATADGFAAWLGPDELLVAGAPGTERTIEQALRAGLSGQIAAVTDVTCGYTTLAIEGASARGLLARGCPLDLHPRSFQTGRCAQSHFAKAQILLLQLDGAPTYELLVRRSYADYLWRWLRAHLADRLPGRSAADAAA